MSIDGEHAARILNRIGALNDLRDCTLVAGIDKQKFRVHRIMMIAASCYFEALLGPNFREGNKTNDEIELTELAGDTLRTVIDFCYTGRVDITADNINELVLAASSMELLDLEQKCCQFWNKHLQITNCVNIFLNADKFSFQSLRRKSFRLLCKQFESIPYDDFQRFDSKNLIELLKYDRIEANEERIFDCIRYWIGGENSRTENVVELLQCVRLERIATQFLNDEIEPVFMKFGCTNLIAIELERRHSKAIEIDSSQYRFPSLNNLCWICPDRNSSGKMKIWRFDEFSKTESDIACLNYGLDYVHFGLVVVDNTIYLIGGRNESEYLTNIVGHDLVTGQMTIEPEMNAPRANICPVHDDRFIYVFGGFNRSEVMTSCERFDLEERTWSSIKSMNSPRHFYSAVSFKGFIYVAGGSGSQHTTINSVERYDPTTDHWTRLSSMNMAHLDFSLVTSNGFIYATTSDAVERYDPEQDRWTLFVVQDNIYDLAGDGMKGAISIRDDIIVFRNAGLISRVRNIESNTKSEMIHRTKNYDDDIFFMFLF